MQDTPAFADDHDSGDEGIKHRSKRIGLDGLYIDDVDDLHCTTNVRHQEAHRRGVPIHQGPAITVRIAMRRASRNTTVWITSVMLSVRLMSS